MAGRKIGAGWTHGRRAGWIQCGCAIACLTAAIGGGSPVLAGETLKQALTSAYSTNPHLDAERARLRAVDEEGPKARAGWKPIVNGRATYGFYNRESKPVSTSDGRGEQSSYGLTLSQPLFTGFRTRNAVSEAEARIRAAREKLRGVEATTLLAAATAYADVVRDQQLVALNQKNVDVLMQELRAAETRRAVREITLTDVAQARARHAGALSALDLARANLRSSRADFRRVVGHVPGRLSRPRVVSKLLPRSLREAVKIGLVESPLVGAALYEEQAARFSVDKVWGELLPQVRLEANYDRNFGVSNFVSQQDAATIMGRVTVPLYQGGETRARVRQAKHTHVSRIQEIEQARSDARANITSAWSQLMAARARLQSDNVQVSAAKLALDGVRTEEKVGQRSLLDVLNAEQEVVQARTALARTQRDTIVAHFSLLGAIGRLDASYLTLDTEHYDPVAHYEEAKNKWFTVSVAPLRGRVDDADLPAGTGEPDRRSGGQRVRGRSRVHRAGSRGMPGLRRSIISQ